jgi:hypothetical protein
LVSSFHAPNGVWARASGDHFLADRRDHIGDPQFDETFGTDPDALGWRQLLAMRLRLSQAQTSGHENGAPSEWCSGEPEGAVPGAGAVGLNGRCLVSVTKAGHRDREKLGRGGTTMSE